MTSPRIRHHRTPERLGALPGKQAIGAVLILCGVLFFTCGCARRTARAAAPPASAPAPKPVAAPTKEEPPETPPPVNKVSPPANVTLPLPGPSTAPPKPAPPAHKPAGDNPAPTRPPAPQISPELSPDDQAAYERRTNENISAAEKNLEQASGRKLNSAQKDLVEKIRGFLEQSREAMHQSDWTRAQNLSQKAYLLSVELMNSP